MLYINGKLCRLIMVEEQLSAPTISLDGDILTITDESGLATSFDVLVGGEVKGTTTSSTFDLSTLGLSEGTHEITVKARASGYADSVASDAVGYAVVVYTLSGVWKIVSSQPNGNFTRQRFVKDDNVNVSVLGPEGMEAGWSSSISFWPTAVVVWGHTADDTMDQSISYIDGIFTNISSEVNAGVKYRSSNTNDINQALTIDFGEGVSVSKEFYDVFIANATKQ